MTRSLTDVYESARLNVPVEAVADRSVAPSWSALDERVRYELEVLQGNILSVLSGDNSRLLATHHRVISQFNRGLRFGYLGSTEPPEERDRAIAGQQPFQWGERLGRQARASSGALTAGGPSRVFSQFVTATHLLAYEFGQLDQAYSDPLEFVRREVGPQHAKAYGELVFALPVLLNYRAELVRDVLVAGRSFDFDGYHAAMPTAPSHLEYLEHGLVALFDPRPDAWIEVALDLGLAAKPFADGHTILDDSHNAPVQAALAVVTRPITACTLLRKQVERIELAREWGGWQQVSLEPSEEDEGDTTLWDVFELMPCATIRGGEQRPLDLVGYELVRALAAHLERSAAPGMTRFAHLRRHLPAFARGFDERFEAALDARAIATARIGAEVGGGLRRFGAGERYVDTTLELLRDLDKAVRDLEHAAERPVDFVRARLAENAESPVVSMLLETIEEHPQLAAELFQEHPERDFFSSTTIQTGSPFDLIRSALFHAIQAQSPHVAREDEREEHRGESRAHLVRLVERCTPRHRGGGQEHQRYSVVLTRDSGSESLDEQMLMAERGKLLIARFESLERVLKGVLDPLHVAFQLNRRIVAPDAGLVRTRAPISR